MHIILCDRCTIHTYIYIVHIEVPFIWGLFRPAPIIMGKGDNFAGMSYGASNV